MIMDGDTTTSAGHPLTFGTLQPGMEIEGTVDPTIANQDSEMAMAIMRSIQVEEILIEGLKKEVEAEASHLRMTNPTDETLGGSPDKITSLTGSELASSGEGTKI